MNYTEIRSKLEIIKNELINLGCNPVADEIQEAIDTLDYARNQNLIY